MHFLTIVIPFLTLFNPVLAITPSPACCGEEYHSELLNVTCIPQHFQFSAMQARCASSRALDTRNNLCRDKNKYRSPDNRTLWSVVGADCRGYVDDEELDSNEGVIAWGRINSTFLSDMECHYHYSEVLQRCSTDKTGGGYVWSGTAFYEIGWM
ncbi:hypothetical protein B0J14DRAFT_654750 [Halenospora varia]|nr:hypothetical protein B0J14DRAFT_654750 [Halenospora varia]